MCGTDYNNHSDDELHEILCGYTANAQEKFSRRMVVTHVLREISKRDRALKDGRVQMEASHAKGRCYFNFPAAMSSIDRAGMFMQMSQWDIAVAERNFTIVDSID
jgi:hypothetical protein